MDDNNTKQTDLVNKNGNVDNENYIDDIDIVDSEDNIESESSYSSKSSDAIKSKPNNNSKNSLKTKIRWTLISITVIVGLILIGFIIYTILIDIGIIGNRHDNSLFDKTSGSHLITVEKPIIYLYPETKTDLTIKLGQPEKLTTVYPKYNDGWRITAWPDGKLKDQNSGRELYSLYWEGKNDELDISMDSGFVVKGEDAAEFLEEKLTYLGLNYREAEEFIVYWLPKMKENPYNFIYFMTEDEIEREMPTSISEKPDTMIRVRMVFKTLDEFVEIPEEELIKAPEREGFTLVEWGGINLNDI